MTTTVKVTAHPPSNFATLVHVDAGPPARPRKFIVESGATAEFTVTDTQSVRIEEVGVEKMHPAQTLNR